MTETWHGTAGGYSNHHCRCQKCKTAWREYGVVQRRSRLARPHEIPHGTRSGYINWGCRCDRCCLAKGVIPRRLRRQR